MVDGCRAELDREAHPAALAELVAVHAHAEARGRAGLEDAAGLLGRERPALAERVDPARVRRARGQHLADDEVDVLVGAVGVLGRHHVGAEEGDLLGDLAGEPHEALLVDDREAVARLHLERRGALRVQLVTNPASRARSSSSVAARVAATVERMPPAS